MRLNGVGGQPERRPPAVVRLVSSVWFGVTMLALILGYSSVVSAWPPVRWALEMTEMQAFRHWFFVLLAVLFSVSLILATLWRVRWSVTNSGVLLAHAGLLLLMGGAFAYFGTKIEGDVLLESPAIYIRTTVTGRPMVLDRFRAGAGESWGRELPIAGGLISFKVLQTRARGIQPVGEATVSTQFGSSTPKVVTLSDQALDWQPVAEQFQIRLVTAPPQSDFYDNETPALYIREAASGRESVRVIRHLPIHRERYVPGGEVLRDARGTEIPSKRTRPAIHVAGLAIPTGWFEPWRMPIDVEEGDLPFSIRITGYVPYVASMRAVSAPDGRIRQEPVLEVKENRRADVTPRGRSAIRMQITGRGVLADWSDTQWCVFSGYPDTDAQPIGIDLPGNGGHWEIVYSRGRHALGATLALQKASVTYFPGQRAVESFRSDIFAQGADGVPRAAVVSTNNTFTVGHWTLFQSGFAGDDHWSYTILGVGNRLGMWPMNIGWMVVALGCLYAFYVKPALLRRRQERAAEGALAVEHA